MTPRRRGDIFWACVGIVFAAAMVAVCIVYWPR
jgi:hypothetical protein